MLIVESSIPGSGRVLLLHHCLFCLRKVLPHGWTAIGDAVQKWYRETTTLSENLIEEVIVEEEFPVSDFNLVWSQVMGANGGVVDLFPKAPTLCIHCGRVLEQIASVLRKLSTVTAEIKKVIRDSGKDGVDKDGRYFKFVNELKCAPQANEGSQRTTLNFLERIGHGTVNEQEYQEWFSVIKDEKVEVMILDESEVNAEPGSIVPSFKRTSNNVVTLERVTLKQAQEQQAGSMDTAQPNDVEIEEVPVDKDVKPKLPKSAKRKPRRIKKPRVPRTPPEPMQSCGVCKQRLPKLKMLDHMKEHIGDYVVKCPNPRCLSVFPNFGQLRVHLHSSGICKSFRGTSGDDYICELCIFSTNDIYSFRRHLEIDHSNSTNSKSYECPVSTCTERFGVRQAVQIHLNLHFLHQGASEMDSNSQTCPLCPSKLPQDQIREHLETGHEIPSESIISCGHCPYIFSSREQLIDHSIVHMRNGIPVSCDLCPDVKYLKLYRLRKHYFEEHQIGTLVLCQYCQKSYWTKDHLNSHIRTYHSGNGAKEFSKWTYKCQDCNDGVTYSQATLISHRIKIHGGEPFKCQYCEKSFLTKGSHRKHENNHKGVAPLRYPCDLPGCHRSFNSQKSLDFHKLSKQHVGNTNAFVCPDCGKGFNLEVNLINHLNTVHNPERKFVCQECGESFKLSNVLKLHMRIHTGEKPFECEICKQKFRHKGVLKTHLKAHQEKGADFKPKGSMKKLRKRVNPQ